MPRTTVSMTDAFKAQISGYAQKRGISFAAALVELAALGYEQVGGKPAPALREWGGDRKSENYRKYQEWLDAQSDYDPAADQDGDYSFAAWLGKHAVQS